MDENRRYTDKHVIETIITSCAVGFFGAVFGVFISVSVIKKEIEYISASIKDTTTVIRNEVLNIRDIEKRVAVLESKH